MAIQVTAGIVRILNRADSTVGTGFVVHKEGLIATCAHVIASAGYGPSDRVSLIFQETGAKAEAVVEPTWWCAPLAEDVAILQLTDPLPSAIPPLPLGESSGTVDHPFQSYGYPAIGTDDGLYGAGQILGGIVQQGIPLLQIDSSQVTVGFSGGPVFDRLKRRVVGMVTAIVDPDAHGRLRDVAFVTPTETLRETCDKLRLADICPYQNLEPFDEEKAEFFFGRADLVNKLVEKLRGQQRFLAVVGPSGSGKSSVVRAGLFPELRKGQVPGSQHWHIITFRPGSDPFAALAATKVGLPQSGGWLKTIADFINNHPEIERLVLFADQFEELFTLADRDIQKRFATLINELRKSDLPVTFILAVRADFYSDLLRTSLLAGDWLKLGQENVLPMSRRELSDAVRMPAEQLGLRFEEGLADEIVSNAEPIDHPLPLLESALTRLWDIRVDGAMTWEGYQKIGGVSGAIGQWAEDSFQGLTDLDKELAQRIFTRLIHYGTGEMMDTRQPQELGALESRPDEHERIFKIVRSLADKRLLVTGSSDPSTEAERVEIIHDALLEEWRRLRRWRTEQREFLLWRQRLDEDITEYTNKNQDTGLLLRGAGLAEAENWLQRKANDLIPEERRYIRSAITQRDEEERQREREQKKRQRLNQWLSIALGGALIATILALIFFVRARSNEQEALSAQATAETEAMISHSRELAAQAVTNMTIDPARSIQLALEGSTVAHTAESRDALRRSLHTSHLKNSLPLDAPVRDVVFSADGAKLFTAGDEGIISIWEPFSKQVLLSWTGHISPIRSIALDPLGLNIATASDDRTIVIWDASDGTKQNTLRGHTDRIYGIEFSPDGTWLASASRDKTACIWDVISGEEVKCLDHQDWVIGVAFSPDGRRLAMTSYDGNAQIWNVITQTVEMMLSTETALLGVDFSPDSNHIVTCSGDMTAKLWNLDTPSSPIAVLRGHSDTVFDAEFSADGRRLGTTSYDGTVRIWDTTDFSDILPVLSLHGHKAATFGLAFSPDGSSIATASLDQHVFLWSLAAHNHWINDLAFSSDGQRLVTASYDHTARIWDVMSGKLLSTLEDHNDTVLRAVFSPDNRYVATASADGLARVWNVQTSQIHRTLAGHSKEVNSIKYSPDGKLLATASYDGTSIIWDAQTGELMFVLQGHSSAVNDVAFSVDGSWLVSVADDSNVILWDTFTGKQLDSFSTNDEQIFRVATGPNELQIITLSQSGTIDIWHKEAGHRTQISPEYSHRAFGLAIRADHTMLATGGNDGYVRLYDDMLANVSAFQAHDERVFGVAFSPDGKYVASTGADGMVLLHALANEELEAQACHLLGMYADSIECGGLKLYTPRSMIP